MSTTTASKVRSLILRDYEVRRLKQAGSVVVVRPVKLPPGFDKSTPAMLFRQGVSYPDLWAWTNERDLSDPRWEMFGLPFPCPIGGMSDLVLIREKWGITARWPLSDQDRHIERGGPWLPGDMAYAADMPEGHWCWRSASQMPAWASRITARVQSIQAIPIRDVTEEDARDTGVHGALLSLGNRAFDEFERVACRHMHYFDPGPGIRVVNARCYLAAAWNRFQGTTWYDNPVAWVVRISTE